MQAVAVLAEQLGPLRELLGAAVGATLRVLHAAGEVADEVGRAAHAHEGALLVEGERPLGLTREQLAHLCM